MVMQAFLAYIKRKMSLTVEVSLLLVLVAIIPLLVTVTISQSLSRPQLVNQSANAMAQDAHTRVQLIDAYLQERLRDVKTISNISALQEYMQGDSSLKPQALNALAVGSQNDVNYDSWSILDLQGNAQLWYPTQPRVHGQNLIPPDTLKQIQISANPSIGGVFYNPEIEDASITVYMPIMGTSSKVVGIIRTEFFLNYIWNIVNSQANEDSSYAFILDQRGVRIAYTNSGGSTLARSGYLFKAIAPLSPEDQGMISAEDLYGNGKKPVTVLRDPMLASIQNDPHAPSRLEMTPAGQTKMFEVVKVHISVVTWTYFALRPLESIVSIADQQLYTTLLIAAISLVLAIIIGVAMGRRVTQPILRSIVQQQQAYEQQHHLNQLKDQILLTVSHELRTPLTEVYGYLELLKMYNHELDEATKLKFLKYATGGCEELQLLINDMLDTVRTDNQPKIVRLQNIELAKTVKDVLDLFNPRTLQNYELQIVIPEELMVKGDQQYLRQVLRNLLSNAFKYTPPQTRVVIDAHPVEGGLDAASMVTICVKDSGPGIASEDIPLLFEKFARLKRDLSSSIRGVGLGLYICKQLVEAMGGSIRVESTGIEGEGSQFCFTLPLVVEQGSQKKLNEAREASIEPT